MMSKCAKCGASWTSLGMLMCPMCGTPVPKPPDVSESGRHERIAPPGPVKEVQARPLPSALFAAPPQLGSYQPQMAAPAPVASSPPPPPPKEPDPKPVAVAPDLRVAPRIQARPFLPSYPTSKRMSSEGKTPVEKAPVAEAPIAVPTPQELRVEVPPPPVTVPKPQEPLLEAPPPPAPKPVPVPVPTPQELRLEVPPAPPKEPTPPPVEIAVLRVAPVAVATPQEPRIEAPPPPKPVAAVPAPPKEPAPAPMDKALTSAHLAIPAETDMYVPQMVGRRLKDPTQTQAPIQPPELRVVRRVQPPPPEPKDPTPPPAPKPPPKLVTPPAAPELPDFGFESITVPPAPSFAPSRESASEGKPEAKKPPPTDFSFDRIEVVPTPPAPKAPVDDTDSDDSWYCSLPEIAPPPPPKPARDPRAHAPIRPRLEPIACTETTQVVDASVLVDTVRQRRTAKTLPMPARPLSAPLVLGVFAALAALFLPLTAALEGNRIFGILGVCISGLLLPIAPLAWIAGLAAERRRREQGLRTERRVLVGRLLGQWGTMLLAAEGTLGLFLVAALRITGKFPISFWAP